MSKHNKRNNLVKIVNYLDKPEPYNIGVKRDKFSGNFYVLKEYFKVDEFNPRKFVDTVAKRLKVQLGYPSPCGVSPINSEYMLYSIYVPFTKKFESPVRFNNPIGYWYPEIDPREIPKSKEELQQDLFGRGLAVDDEVAFIIPYTKIMSKGIIDSIVNTVCYINYLDLSGSHKAKRFCNQVSKK